jgi:hypothetical protein
MSNDSILTRKHDGPKASLELLEEAIEGRSELLDAIPIHKMEIVKHKDLDSGTLLDRKVLLGSIEYNVGENRELWAYMHKTVRPGAMPGIRFLGFLPTDGTYLACSWGTVLTKAKFRDEFQILASQKEELSVIVKV